MKLVQDMVYFDKSNFKKLRDQISEVQNTYMGTFSHDSIQNALQKLEDRAKDAQSDYRTIFQSAFKNLEDHVKDVQNSHRNKFRRGNFQKLYRSTSVLQGPANDHTAPLMHRSSNIDMQSYHESLCSSLQVFQIQKWRPLTATCKPRTSNVRIPPVIDRPRSSLWAPFLSFQPRPESEPDSKFSTHNFPAYRLPRRTCSPKVVNGKLDTFTASNFSNLIKRSSNVTYPTTFGNVLQHTSRDGHLREECINKVEVSNCDNSSTSGIESDSANSADDKDNIGDMDDNQNRDEKSNQTQVEFCTYLPNLHLPPGTLDQASTLDNQPDATSLYFRDEKLEEPIYQFMCPVPSPLDTINPHEHAEENSNWRQGNVLVDPVDPIVSAIFDRLVQMEKLQIETQEWEERRVRLTRKRTLSRTSKSRDKRCCNTCLQITCGGECLDKRVDTNCSDRCYYPQCNDSCKDSKQESCMRQPNENTKLYSETTAALQQCCHSCQKGHNTKIMNTNEVLPIRPKSPFYRANRSRSSSKPREFRYVSALNISGSSKAIDKLGHQLFQPTPPNNVKHPQTRTRAIMTPAAKNGSSFNNSMSGVASKRSNSFSTKSQSTPIFGRDLSTEN